MISRRSFFAFLGCLAIAASGAQGDTIINPIVNFDLGPGNHFTTNSDNVPRLGLIPGIQYVTSYPSDFIGGEVLFIADSSGPGRVSLDVNNVSPGMAVYTSANDTAGSATIRFDRTPPPNHLAGNYHPGR